MRAAYLFSVLVIAMLAAALTGLFDNGAATTVAVSPEANRIELGADTTPPTVASTTPPASIMEREPDVDALGEPVEDHLGTTTTEPPFEVAALPSPADPPSTEPPPPGTQPPASVASTTTTAPPPPPPAGGPNAEFESQFASLINSYRSNNGLAGLTRDGSLDSRARSWSEQMANSGGLSHSNIGSLLPPWSIAGENVGTGGSVGAIFDALAASSGHRANMLGSAYTHYGVGVWVDSAGVIWTTHVFAG
jgi:uncharacterized protein YkwD